MRQFCIILTREGRFRFAFLNEDHGLLHDKAAKRSYAIVKDAYPTNWPGKWSRAYFVSEEHAQSARLLQPEAPPRDEAPAHEAGGCPDAPSAHGASVEIAPPLNMLAKLTLPRLSGRAGEEAHTQLTAEAIFDRTQSAQVRRLGNRRFNPVHVLLFVSLGIAIGLALVAAVLMFSSGGDEPPGGPVLEVDPNQPPAVPQSGPAQESTISVNSSRERARARRTQPRPTRALPAGGVA